MLRRSDVLAEARSWARTPLRWQASVKGLGCDCKGFIWGVARELGLPEAESSYARMSNYARVDTRLLREGLRELFDPATDMQPADVLLLNVRGKAQHLALYMGDGRMMHASPGCDCVLDVPMGQVWRTAIDSIWAWRGLDDA